MEKTEVIGIWDDHDYGVNDGGKEYPKKDESRDLLFDFLDVDTNHPAWNRKGAYQTYNYDFEGKRLKIILLDTRYFRDPLKKNKEGMNVPNYEGKILGDEQWEWFKIQLDDPEIDLFIIGSSIQVIPKDHRFEKWANFPNERNWLLAIIREKVKAPVIFISGDRHISELSKLEMADYDYPVYDVTSSSLTHGWSERKEEKNEYRVGSIIHDENFAVLTINWKKKIPQVSLKYVGESNVELGSFKLD